MTSTFRSLSFYKNLPRNASLKVNAESTPSLVAEKNNEELTRQIKSENFTIPKILVIILFRSSKGFTSLVQLSKLEEVLPSLSLYELPSSSAEISTSSPALIFNLSFMSLTNILVLGSGTIPFDTICLKKRSASRILPLS